MLGLANECGGRGGDEEAAFIAVCRDLCDGCGARFSPRVVRSCSNGEILLSDASFLTRENTN